MKNVIRSCFKYSSSECKEIEEWLLNTNKKELFIKKKNLILINGEECMITTILKGLPNGLECVLSKGFLFEGLERFKIYGTLNEFIGAERVIKGRIGELYDRNTEILIMFEKEKGISKKPSDMFEEVMDKAIGLEQNVRSSRRILSTIKYIDFSEEEELLSILRSYIKFMNLGSKPFKDKYAITKELTKKLEYFDLIKPNNSPEKDCNFRFLKSKILGNTDKEEILKACMEEILEIVEDVANGGRYKTSKKTCKCVSKLHELYFKCKFDLL